MSNINEIILYEMQPLVNMLDAFKQALNIPATPMQFTENPTSQSMPNGNVQTQSSAMPDDSMINSQLTQ